MKFCRIRKAPTDVPFEKLPKKWQDWVINGDPDYGKDKQHEWPRAWYGIKGYFRWLESKSYKMHVRVLLSRYRVLRALPGLPWETVSARGVAVSRWKRARSRMARQPGRRLTLADFYLMPVRDALRCVERFAAKLKPSHTIRWAWS